MKKAICILACTAMLLMTTGCANGPIRSWLRGAICSRCNPPVGQPENCGVNLAEPCANGACGTNLDISQPIIHTPGQNGAFGSGVVPTPTENPNFSDPNFNNPAPGVTTQTYQYPSADVYGVGTIDSNVVPRPTSFRQ